mgnify:CR=1 FL=1
MKQLEDTVSDWCQGLVLVAYNDRIKKFITTIIGGFILQKLVDFAPQLGEIIKVINTGISQVHHMTRFQ